jgi:hypothetical protein
MASLHRKYQDRIEVGPRQEAPPVSAPPRAAELPEPAANAGKPPPEVETESPAEKAGKDALRQRLAEMERAETLTRQAQQPPPRAAEPQTGEEMTPVYYDRMEQMLGLRQQPPVGAEGRPQSNGNGQVESRPSAPPRNEAPPDHSRGQAPRRAMAAPVSAPPTREVPSMTTGRAPRHRAPLTADELQIAQQCGQTPEEYQQQKEKMQHLKQIGAIQDGR